MLILWVEKVNLEILIFHFKNSSLQDEVLMSLGKRKISSSAWTVSRIPEHRERMMLIVHCVLADRQAWRREQRFVFRFHSSSINPLQCRAAMNWVYCEEQVSAGEEKPPVTCHYEDCGKKTVTVEKRALILHLIALCWNKFVQWHRSSQRRCRNIRKYVHRQRVDKHSPWGLFLATQELQLRWKTVSSTKRYMLNSINNYS